MNITGRQNNNIDFLRLFGAICVTFAHSFNHCYPYHIEPLANLSKGKTNFADIGLCIFFSISGYLIVKSALTSSSIKQYFWKRLLRIQPLLIIVCILTVFLLGPFFTNLPVLKYFSNIRTWTYFRNVFPLTGMQFNLPEVFGNYIGEKGVNGSLWTLVVEERLYLVLGVVIFLPVYNKYFWYLLVGGINICYLINVVSRQNILPYFNNSTMFYALLFINSSVMYLLEFNFVKNLTRYLVAGVLLFLLTLILPAFLFLQLYLIPVIILSISQIKCFANGAGKYGDFSYGIYVFSFPVQQMLVSIKILKENPYMQFLVTLLLVLPVAVLSWHFVEKKFLTFKNYVK